MSDSIPAPARATAAPAPSAGWIAAPRRSRLGLILVASVALAMLLALGVAARASLMPSRHVSVRQVIFDRAAPDAPAAIAPQPGNAPQPANAPPPTSPARRANTPTVQAAGWLEADPFVTACAALAEGTVSQVLVQEGDQVQVGDAVATLVPDDAQLALRTAHAELEAAHARAQSVAAELTAAQANWDQPVDREREVAVAAATLARAQAEQVQLVALVAAEQARLEQLEAQLSRARTAMASGGATEIETIILEKQAAAQAATVDAMRLREAILAAEIDRAGGEHSAAQRAARLRIAERRALDMASADALEAGADARLAGVRADEAALRLDRMTIRSPITGVVQRRRIVPGTRLMVAGDNPDAAIVAYLYDPASLQVRVDVPLADAANISVGQPCEVVVEILPDQTFTGVVTRIAHEADLQKNTLQVKVRVQDPSPMLRPEMLTRVRFLGSDSTGSTRRSDASPAGSNSASGSHVHAPAHQPADTSSPSTPDADHAPAPAFADSAVLIHPSTLDPDAASPTVWVVRDRRGSRGHARAVRITLTGTHGDYQRALAPLSPGDLLIDSPRALSQGTLVTFTLDAPTLAARPTTTGARP